MTFSLILHCTKTGRFGAAFATKTIAVGVRCVTYAPAFGVAVSQATVHTELNRIGARLLSLGSSAAEVLAGMVAFEPHVEYRQLGVLTATSGAGRTGSKNFDWAGHLVLPGAVVMGNVLTSEKTLAAMAKSVSDTAGRAIEDRLLLALEAGRDAGGQKGGQASSSLLIFRNSDVPELDLRVDEHAEPVGELRRIFTLYRPLLPYYELQRRNPVGLPRYLDWLAEQKGKVTA